MPSFRELTKLNAGTSCAGKLAVVSGGTQGIGSGVALRFAQSGARVWIVGRDAVRAEAVLDELRVAGKDAVAQADDGRYAFIAADLSSIAGIKAATQALAAKAGEGGIDFLVETQGGLTNGYLKDSAEGGPERGFCVQSVSRFGLAHLLLESRTLKEDGGLCMIAAPGKGTKDPLEVDDLDFTHAKSEGNFSEGLGAIGKIAARDSSVLDAAAQTLAERHPSLTTIHLYPGIVSTNIMANGNLPWLMVQSMRVFSALGLLATPRPGSLPEVPFYLLANPAAKDTLTLGGANLRGPKLEEVQISVNVKDKEARQKVWEKLEAYFS